MTELSEGLRRRAVEARREHRPDEARRALIEAVALCRQAGEEIDLAKALTALGQIERDLRNNDAALKNYEEAAAIYRTKADLQKLAHTIRHVGDIHRNLGRNHLADPFYREALDLYRGDLWALCRSTWQMPSAASRFSSRTPATPKRRKYFGKKLAIFTLP